MSRILINKILVKLAVDHSCILKPDQLPAFWAKTPSNLAYRLREKSGWNIKGTRNKRTGRIIFQRFTSKNKIKHN